MLQNSIKKHTYCNLVNFCIQNIFVHLYENLYSWFRSKSGCWDFIVTMLVGSKALTYQGYVRTLFGLVFTPVQVIWLHKCTEIGWLQYCILTWSATGPLYAGIYWLFITSTVQMCHNHLTRPESAWSNIYGTYGVLI